MPSTKCRCDSLPPWRPVSRRCRHHIEFRRHNCSAIWHPVVIMDQFKPDSRSYRGEAEEMAIGEVVGLISELWRFPVKSMGGERLSEVEVTERGFHGDRAYALIDMETGRVVSAKSVKRFPGLLNCKASFVEPAQMGH